MSKPACARRSVGKRIAAARTGDPTVLRIMVTRAVPGGPGGAHGSRASSGAGTSCASRWTAIWSWSSTRCWSDATGWCRPEPNAPKRIPARSPWRSCSRTRPSCSTSTTSGWARSTSPAPRTRKRSRSTASWASTCCRPPSRARRSAALIARRRDQVRAFLMDKRALASIGNAYADEILFAAGLHPKTFCNKLAPADDRRAPRRDRRACCADAIAEIRRRDEPIEVKVRDFLKVRGPRRQAVRRVRHDHPRRARRRRRRLLLPALPARDAQAVRQLDAASTSAAGGGAGCAPKRVQEDRAGGRDVERIGARGHRDRDAVVAGGARGRGQARALGAEQQREARRRRESAPAASRPGRRPRRRASMPSARSAARSSGQRPRAHDGQREHRPQRDADRLAVERIGAARATARSASAPNAAAWRASAPRLSTSVRSSSTTSARAPRGSGAGAGRSPIARQPRWTWNPAIASSTGCAATKTGNGPPSASASVARRGGVSSTECTVRPLSTSRRTTRSLSATNRPPSALRCRSLSRR